MTAVSTALSPLEASKDDCALHVTENTEDADKLGSLIKSMDGAVRTDPMIDLSPTWIPSSDTDEDSRSIITVILKNNSEAPRSTTISRPSWSSFGSLDENDSVANDAASSNVFFKIDTTNSDMEMKELRGLASPTWLTSEDEDGGNHDLTRQQQQQQEQQRLKESSAPINGLWVTIAALSIFSILGNALRLFIEGLTGAACAHHAPTWLSSVSERLNFCVTSSETALFYDLPVNMIGSFIMGVFQPCQDIGLKSSVPVAFLHTNHWFQSSQVIHIAVRTGFCGSLTTFASWNTSMLQLLSEGEIITALVGYIIGAELAVSSLRLGQQISVWIHRYVNPDLAHAEDLITSLDSSPINKSVMQKVYQKNQALPDFERRYLDGLVSEQEADQAKQQIAALDALHQWKKTTQNHRHHRKTSSFSQTAFLTMHEIEHKIIVEHKNPSEYVLQAARAYGWDVDALKAWAEQAIVNSDNSQIQQQCKVDVNKHSDVEGGDSVIACTAEQDASSTASCLPSQSYVNTMRILFLQAFLALGLVVYYGLFSFRGTDTSYYQSSLISSLVSPFGTILRWYLSRLNGKLKGRWNWFPLGTFLANISASMISALILGLSIHSSSRQSALVLTSQAEWSANIILNGVRIGFTGCLSTVSTLATEFDKINKSFPHHAKAIHYMTSSFLAACVLGIVIYAPLVT